MYTPLLTAVVGPNPTPRQGNHGAITCSQYMLLRDFRTARQATPDSSDQSFGPVALAGYLSDSWMRLVLATSSQELHVEVGAAETITQLMLLRTGAAAALTLQQCQQHLASCEVKLLRALERCYLATWRDSLVEDYQRHNLHGLFQQRASRRPLTAPASLDGTYIDGEVDVRSATTAAHKLTGSFQRWDKLYGVNRWTAPPFIEQTNGEASFTDHSSARLKDWTPQQRRRPLKMSAYCCSIQWLPGSQGELRGLGCSDGSNR